MAGRHVLSTSTTGIVTKRPPGTVVPAHVTFKGCWIYPPLLPTIGVHPAIPNYRNCLQRLQGWGVRAIIPGEEKPRKVSLFSERHCLFP